MHFKKGRSRRPRVIGARNWAKTPHQKGLRKVASRAMLVARLDLREVL